MRNSRRTASCSTRCNMLHVSCSTLHIIHHTSIVQPATGYDDLRRTPRNRQLTPCDMRKLHRPKPCVQSRHMRSCSLARSDRRPRPSSHAHTCAPQTTRTMFSAARRSLSCLMRNISTGAHSARPPACAPLRGAWCALHATHCMLYIACFTLHASRCMLHAA